MKRARREATGGCYDSAANCGNTVATPWQGEFRMQGTQHEAAAIRVGVGGWTFEPWRDNFYPKGWPAAKELEYASRKLTAIEVNGTYYSTQRPESFAKWRQQTPDGFVFSLKASRFATNRRVLAEAGESIERFVASGITELGPKLGPIVWQFAPTKRFDAADFEAFLKLLPARRDGTALRHVLDVRHESFKCAPYLALARRYGAATVFTDSDDYPSFADVTGGFVYVRTMRTDATLPQGCTPRAFDQIAACCTVWRNGGEPQALPRIEGVPLPAQAPRDVFLYFISGAKEKAPAAAMAVLDRLR
jgi:uncharacterized protein YecE (DUF72 family)